jgi:predicted GH43/DUF377 family glycosyl hydrolase
MSTPGPWVASRKEEHGTRVVGDSDLTVAWCGTNSTYGVASSYLINADEAFANAHLIATAPEMLKVLEEVALMEGWNGASLTERYRLDPEGLNPYEKRIVAIIAKAKGEPQ